MASGIPMVIKSTTDNATVRENVAIGLRIDSGIAIAAPNPVTTIDR